MNWSTLLKWYAGIAILVVLPLRIAGFIGDFWATIAIVALIVGFVAIQLLPESGRKPASIVYLALVALGLAKAGWNSFLETRPGLREAIEYRKAEKDLELAELVDPEALRARVGLREFCQYLEDRQGAWVQYRLQRERELLVDTLEYTSPLADTSGYTPPRPSQHAEAEVRRIRAFIDSIHAYQRECEKEVRSGGATAKPSGSDRWPSVREIIPELDLAASNNPMPRWGYWLIGGLVALGIAGSLKRPISRYSSLAAMLTVLFFGDAALYAGRQKQTVTAQPRTQQTRPQQRSARQAQTVRREVASGTLVTLTGRYGPDCTGIQVPPRASVEIAYVGGRIDWFGLPVTVGSDYVGWPTWANQNVPAGERIPYAMERCHYRNTCIVLKYGDGRDVVTQFGPGERRAQLRNFEPVPAELCLDLNTKQSYLADRTGELRHDGRSWLTGAMQFRIRVSNT